MRWQDLLYPLGFLLINAVTLRKLKAKGPGENPQRYFRLLTLSKVIFVSLVVLLITGAMLILLQPTSVATGGPDDVESACAGLMGIEPRPETSPEAREAFLKAREALCGPQ